MQELLLHEIEHDNMPSDGYVHEEIGENLLALGQKGNAAPHFKEAYTLLAADQWLPEAEPERIERLRLLGNDLTD